VEIAEVMRALGRHSAAIALSLIALGAGVRPARADDPAATPPVGPSSAEQSPEVIEKASRLYEAGSKAHADGRFAEAARFFAEADDLVPDAAALEAAMLAALETDDAVLAMRLASRTAREPFNASLMDLADQTRRRFGAQVGRVVVHCEDCEAAIDGTPVDRGVATIVRAGPHEVRIDVGARRERRRVDVEPSSVVTLVPVGSAEEGEGGTGSTTAQQPSATTAAPTSPPKEAPPSGDGASPAWFWVGLGLTAVAAGGVIASGVDTANRHDEFAASPSPETADAGERAQLRTNVLIGVAAGLGIATGVVGIFVVDWGSGSSSAALSVSPLGGRLRVTF
jgi:hypothetical protein